MPAGEAMVVVAGHICLDIFPTFGDRSGGVANLLVPGSLIEIGAALMSTGGAVPNTGLALHRLGVPTRLMAKIGDDLFGRAILGTLENHDPALSKGMLVTPGAQSSYTLVISPPGVDRFFFHYRGPNDTFSADDVPYQELEGVRLFHFGYPPVMRRMYADGGIELETMFRRVKERGIATSLDMAKPDPATDAGRAPWKSILERVLPQVDVFLPSLDEILFMLGRDRAGGTDWQPQDSQRIPGTPGPPLDGALLGDVVEELLALRAGVVGLKLGEHGLYVRTTRDHQRLAALRKAADDRLDSWVGRELLTPCFEVDVVGTTGCGDCTIAGFLAGLLHRLPLEQAMTAAVAVGACNVERADAVSGVPTWEAVQARIRSGWKKRPSTLALPGWTWDAAGTMAIGPNDSANTTTAGTAVPPQHGRRLPRGDLRP